MLQPHDDAPFPLPLSDYSRSAEGLFHQLAARIDTDPFNAIATAIFVLAVVHPFVAARFTDASHHLQHRCDAEAAAAGLRAPARTRVGVTLTKTAHRLAPEGVELVG
jgi:hypothetical protein